MRDIGIHKDVEKELAKRSQFCQKVIKKLRDENKALQDQLNDYNQESQLPLRNTSPVLGGVNSPVRVIATPKKQDKPHNFLSTRSTRNSTTIHNSGAKILAKSPSAVNHLKDELNASEELISFLESKLENNENSLS